MLSVAVLKKAAATEGGRRAELAKHLQQCVRAESRRFGWGRLAIGIGTFFAAYATSIFVLFLVPSLPPYGFFFLIGSVLLSALAVRVYVRARVARQLASTAVAEGICGSCAYSLQGAVDEPDGCVRCPECGAAWKSLRIVSPHWERRSKAFEPPWLWRFVSLTPRSKDQLAPDDRGRYVRVLDSRLRLASPARRDELGPDRVRSIVRAARRVGRVWRLLVALWPASVGVFMTWLLADVWQSGGFTIRSTLLMISIVIYGSVAYGLLSLIFGHHFAGPKWVIPVFRNARICGSCAMDLSATIPAGDGLTVCSECGSAWRLPPTVGEKT